MAISRAQLAAELEPGLNALFGMEYDQYDQEYADIFSIEDSSKAFEEEVLIVEGISIEYEEEEIFKIDKETSPKFSIDISFIQDAMCKVKIIVNS